MDVDSVGNLYFAEAGSGRIRKVGTNGIITTVAGGGASTSDGIPATSASRVRDINVGDYAAAERAAQ